LHLLRGVILRSFFVVDERKFMRRALTLAKRGLGHSSPNPAVGAVVVRGGLVIGEGYHRRAGSAHAEVEALQAAGHAARGATLYVTLEPCNHYGRTPPCTEAIINAGIREVVYAVADPNPHVSGQGHQRLAAASLTVRSGLCEAEARHLIRFFFHYAGSGRPYVIAKFGASLDGKIATRSGDSQWITGAAARETGHRLRHLVDAILVGAGTAVADDPHLTTRLPQPDVRHPLRILLDSGGRVPTTANLFKPELPGKTLVATTAAMPAAHHQALEGCQVSRLLLPATSGGEVDLAALLNELGRRQITSLLVEGGSQVLGAFFDAGLVNEVWAFIAPFVIGGVAAPGPVAGRGISSLSDAFHLQDVTLEPVGHDFLIKGLIPCSPELLKK
jgi:diaminohydroxyphosphoribosylaminopyrimidine deaminase / 5-amino-6-(5-phosphoribosylamino)uracil reductase